MSGDFTDSLVEAEGWRPNPGDVLVGTVVNISKGWSDYTMSWYPIVQVQREDTGENVNVHSFHTALRNRMLELRPRTGERIGIKFVEERPHKSNPKQTVAVYVVKIDGRDGGADVWDSIEPARPQQPPVGKGDFQQGQPAEDDIPF